MRRDRLCLLLPALVLVLASACGGAGPRMPPSPTPVLSPAEGARPSPSPTPVPQVTLAAVGDVMLDRTIGDGIRELGPLWPFEEVAGILLGADVTFANLESPLSEGGQPAPKDYVFRGPPEAARGLAQAGIDIVSLANNHALDYGPEGLAETRAALETAGVAYVGVGDSEAAARAAVVIERNGLRLAFLAYVNTPPDSGSGFDVSSTAATAGKPGVAWLSSPEAVAEDVARAAEQADVVIVSMHTGLEYQELASELQVAAAHAAIDAGAKLVLGHHPHVLQGIERYKDGLIVYSLGNFVFDFDYVYFAQRGVPAALSVVLRVTLTREKVVSCELVPVVIGDEDGRPHPATGEEAAAVLERLRRLSDGSCGL